MAGARLKFEFTNQNLTGGKNFQTLLTSMYVHRKDIEIQSQLFSLEMALNISRKEIYNSKNYIRLQKIKNMKHLRMSLSF